MPTVRPIPPQLYTGAATCDLQMAFAADLRGDGLALIRTAHDTDPADLMPQLVLADWLEERGDPRGCRLRIAAHLWAQCETLKPGSAAWNFNATTTALEAVTGTLGGWRLACLWGCLVAWHAPAGDGSGRPMGRTWVDARVTFAWRGVWWWSLGLAQTNPTTGAWNQAAAAGKQAAAAWRQAAAALNQAAAALNQAAAALNQAAAALNQATAAEKCVRRFARSCWQLCEPFLSEFEG